jgi:hypothetical protein
MTDKASGWVVTVTTAGIGGPIVRVWYVACADKAAAIRAVKNAAKTTGATFEIAREMSKTLMTSFGLSNGEAKCFD